MNLLSEILFWREIAAAPNFPAGFVYFFKSNSIEFEFFFENLGNWSVVKSFFIVLNNILKPTKMARDSDIVFSAKNRFLK